MFSENVPSGNPETLKRCFREKSSSWKRHRKKSHFNKIICDIISPRYIYIYLPGCGPVSWGTALQAGRSWFRFPMMSLEVLNDNPSGCTMTLGSNVSWGVKRPVLRGYKLTTFLCRLSWNPRASTSWNSQSFFRNCVTFVIYIYIYIYNIV